MCVQSVAIVEIIMDAWLDVEAEIGGECIFGTDGGQCGEDGKHSHHPIVGWSEQASQKNTEKEIEQLWYTVAYTSPNEAFGCFVFQ